MSVAQLTISLLSVKIFLWRRPPPSSGYSHLKIAFIVGRPIISRIIHITMHAFMGTHEGRPRSSVPQPIRRRAVTQRPVCSTKGQNYVKLSSWHVHQLGEFTPDNYITYIECGLDHIHTVLSPSCHGALHNCKTLFTEWRQVQSGYWYIVKTD